MGEGATFTKHDNKELIYNKTLQFLLYLTKYSFQYIFTSVILLMALL